MRILLYHNTWSIFTYQSFIWHFQTLWQIHAPTIPQVAEEENTLHTDMWRYAKVWVDSLAVCINGKTHDIRERYVTIRSEIRIKNIHYLGFWDIGKWVLRRLILQSWRCITKQTWTPSVMRSYGEVVNHQWNVAYASKWTKWHYYACDTKYHKQLSEIKNFTKKQWGFIALLISFMVFCGPWLRFWMILWIQIESNGIF
jgi:hypothetical protein